MIKLEDLDRTHDWDPDAEVGQDPHSSGYYCRVCEISICMFCTPGANMNFEEATTPCPGIPWYEVPNEASRSR